MSLLGLGAVVGNAITPWLGEWVTVAIAGLIVKGIRNQFDPDEMKRVLKEATAAAEAGQPETGGLFFRCQKGGRNGVTKFLGEFFQSSEVLKELKKPLEECGKPDIDILVAALTQMAQSAQQHSEVKNYLPASLRPWMETFVESYFKQIKGICFQVAKTKYSEQLAQQVDDVKFVGIAVSGEEEQKFLAKIFVMPDVRETKNRNSADDIDYGCIVDSAPADLPEQEYQELLDSVRRKNLLQEQKGWATRDRSAPRIPAQKVINLAQKKAVILGAPGSGKTMLASYFALMLCETTQSNPSQIGLEAEDDYLPVVVRIRDWILEPKMGLLEYLRSNAEASLACKELPTGFFEHWLERGRALILLDGLDEVVDEAQRRKVAEQIETFLHQYKDNPAIITSRPAGYRWDFFNLDEFPHYTLESFDDKQVATFIDHWYDSRLKDDKAQADRRKADLQKAFARNERIRLLATNPLLLTIITLIHRYQADLPRRRCDLYEIAVKTLLTQWDLGKEIKWDKDTLHYLKQDDLLYLLKKLAYWIHSKGSVGETEGGTLIKKNDLIEQLRKEIQTRKKCEFDEAEEEAKRFIEFIRKRTGLLNEQGRERYAFVHKTFQEYLTAEEIYSRHKRENRAEIIWNHFRDRLHDQHWCEVLLLLVSKLEGLQAQEAIQTVLDAGSEYEQWLHRDLLFAGWCLTEDPPELTMEAENWVGEILNRLVELGFEDFDRIGDNIFDRIGDKIRGEALDILNCFDETTLERAFFKKSQGKGERIRQIYIFRELKRRTALLQQSETLETARSLYLMKAKKPNDFLSLLTHEKNLNDLLSSLEHKDSTVRCHAARFLGELGKTNSAIASGLLSLLGDEDVCVYDEAVKALVQLAKTSDKILPEVVQWLEQNPHNDGIGGAIDCLWSIVVE
jgi:NACHT domain